MRLHRQVTPVELAVGQVEVWLRVDEVWPTYLINDTGVDPWGYKVTVSDCTLQRWRDAYAAWQVTQSEMLSAIREQIDPEHDL